jgi:branched-chain amino acid transport system permease protein
MSRRWIMPLLLLAGFAAAWAVARFDLVNPYRQQVLMVAGINIILAVSLNLVNGYMGEFSLGHAGFMALGAYGSAIISVMLVPEGAVTWRFPLAVGGGGAAAALAGLLLAIPSFRTRGDYLAIVTLAFTMIVKSVLENIEAVGGPRGMVEMERLTTLPWTYAWVLATVWLTRNFVHSGFGRGTLAIREDEIAAELMGVHTRRTKMQAFVISAFFAGVAGGLFAHLVVFISPKVFDLLKMTDMLVMMYLGGIGSLGGSILGATIFTALQEALRQPRLEVLRMVLMPLLLVLLMLFRPRGIMGLREFSWLIPKDRHDDPKQ